MVIIGILRNLAKYFSSRPKSIPEPTADAVGENTSSPWTRINKTVSRRFRTYGIQQNKQKQLRNLSRNGIVRRGVERIKRGVLNLEYQLEPVGSKKISNRQMEQYRTLVDAVLQQPNLVHDYQAFWDMVLEDIIVLDAGTFNKVKSANRLHPLYLYPVDATTIDILQPYDFTNHNGSRYVQHASWSLDDKEFTTDDLAYLQLNHFTDNPYGLSPIEKLWRYLNYFMDALDNAADIASADTPKFIISIKDAEEGKIKQFREYMQNEIEGSGHVPVIGGECNSAQIGAINADSLFIEWQKFLLTLVAKCFDLPESFFISADVNDRNNLSEVQQQVLQEAIKPYARLLERAINLHVLQTMGVTGVQFKFIFEESLADKKSRTGLVLDMVKSDLITLDEARVKLGEPMLNTKYSQVTITEAKALINEDHGINGFGDAKANNVNDSQTSDPPEKGGN